MLLRLLRTYLARPDGGAAEAAAWLDHFVRGIDTASSRTRGSGS